MASIAMCARVFALLIIVASSYSLTMDEEATNNVVAAAVDARAGGEVAILVRGPHGNAKREELLHARGADDASISLYYNQKSNKVSLESLHGGHLKSVSWGLGPHSKGTLILIISSKRVKLFVGCRALHWHALSTKHDLLDILSSQKLKLYHEENAPVEVYRSERAALDSINCQLQDMVMKPPSLTVMDETDMEEVKDFLANDARRKREEEMQGDEYRNNYIDSNGVLPPPTTQRGDIPSNAIESCDDEVIRHLQMVRQTMEHLRREISEQKATIENLRGQLRNCCNRAPPPAPVERCTGTSCYPGY